MLDKEFNIQAVIESLKGQFPVLDCLSAEVLDNGGSDMQFLIAKRNGLTTLSFCAKTDKVVELLAQLGQKPHENFREFLDHSNLILLDLDSITGPGPWRFYLRANDYDQNWVDSRFPNNEQPDVSDPRIRRLEGIGFYFDPVQGLVAQYKYYWFDLVSRTELRQRFDPQGSLLNSQTVVTSGLADHAVKETFGLTGIDFENFLLKYHYFQEFDQYYITVTKDFRNEFTEYTAQSGGSMAPVPLITIQDPSADQTPSPT